MIYATASAWAQDIRQRFNNTPFNIGPVANLIGALGLICFAFAGVTLWLDQTRSAFVALAAVVILAVGLIMFGTSIVLRAGLPHAVPAKKPAALAHHAAE
jgi:hypothetical protein